MTIPGLFKEYIWLLETINRYGKITFAELNELWKRKGKAPAWSSHELPSTATVMPSWICSASSSSAIDTTATAT